MVILTSLTRKCRFIKLRTNQTPVSIQMEASPSFINSIPGDSYPEMDGMVGPGEYTWQDNNSSCSSLNGSESPEIDSASVSSDSQSPRQRPPKPKVKPKPKFLVAVPDNDNQYMSMDGSSGGSLTSIISMPRSTKIKDQRCKKSGKIPRHKIEEAMATLGFRSDVNGELKRVSSFLFTSANPLQVANQLFLPSQNFATFFHNSCHFVTSPMFCSQWISFYLMLSSVTYKHNKYS